MPGRLRVLSYNIRHGGVGRVSAIATVIRSTMPDLVILQEAVRPDVVRELAGTTGLVHWGATAGYSVGFLSRRPLKHYAWTRPPGSRRAFLDLTASGTSVRVFGVHLSAIHSNWTEWRRVRELRGVLAAVSRLDAPFHVVTGDFNTLAPGESLDVSRLPRRLQALMWLAGGMVRFRTIEVILGAGYADAFRHLHPDQIGYTFPTWNPHVRLDYLFVPSRFAQRVTACTVVDSPAVRLASDHFPLLTELEDC